MGNTTFLYPNTNPGKNNFILYAVVETSFLKVFLRIRWAT